MSDPLPADDVRRIEQSFGPLTESLRGLLDIVIRSEADAADVARAHAMIDEAAALLGTRLDPKPFGVRTSTDGRTLTWGNVAIGLRNAIAPPLDVRQDENGRSSTDLVLGAAYEGPPGHVHGGICALVLDHVLGATAHRPGQPAFTGTLTIRYLRPTRLGPLRAQAWVEREERSKTFATGEITDADGVVTVRAEGVFIRPGGKS